MRPKLLFFLFILAVPAGAWAQAPVGQIFASDATVKGSVELAAGGAKVMSGSYVSAGESTAVLKLDRGGEVRVCPHTSLSVATSQNGRDLMLGISQGGMETHYTVAASADTIVTPDFRILLAGPGKFDFAIEAGRSGDTCIRALPGNSSSLIVSELMGDGAYQVKPAERLVFHNGGLNAPDHDNANCGCVASPPVMRAESVPPATPEAAPAHKRESPETKAELPVHVEVEAPFVFHADDPGPSPLEGAVRLHTSKRPIQLVALGPPAADKAAPANASQPAVDKPVNKPKESRFFGRIKSFFASIFR